MGGRLTCGSNPASLSLTSNSSDGPPLLSKGGGVAADAMACRTVQHGQHSPSLLPSRGVAAPNQPAVSAPRGGNNATIEAKLPQNSIFAATLEYIITRNDLTNCTIMLSTRGMYILSQPRIIKDTRRYEHKISSLPWD